jgi:hypothetical protein
MGREGRGSPAKSFSREEKEWFPFNQTVEHETEIDHHVRVVAHSRRSSRGKPAAHFIALAAEHRSRTA